MHLRASPSPVEVDVERGVCKIDEMDYPIVGFGTYPLTDKVCTTAVKQASRQSLPASSVSLFRAQLLIQPG